MDNRAYAVMTGIFVVVLGVGFMVGAVWLKGPATQTQPYVVVSHDSVYGLMPQSTVFFRGVAAGTVESVAFDPRDTRNILIHIDVDQGTPITRSTIAKLNLQGITGLSQLELENTAADSPLLPTNAQSPARIPLQPSILDKVSKSGADAVSQLDSLATSLNRILNGSSQRHIRDLLANVDLASAELVTLERRINRTATVMPSMARKSAATLDHVNELITTLDALGRSLQYLSQSSQYASNELTSRTLPRLDQTLYQMSRAASDIHRLSVDFTNDPQRLLFGPQRPPPGPGEPGYKGLKP